MQRTTKPTLERKCQSVHTRVVNKIVPMRVARKRKAILVIIPKRQSDLYGQRKTIYWAVTFFGIDTTGCILLSELPLWRNVSESHGMVKVKSYSKACNHLSTIKNIADSADDDCNFYNCYHVMFPVSSALIIP